VPDRQIEIPERGHGLETTDVNAQRHIIGVSGRESGVIASREAEAAQAGRVTHAGRRTQQQMIHDVEHHGVHREPERERDHDRDYRCRRAQRSAHGESDVLAQVRHHGGGPPMLLAGLPTGEKTSFAVE
jgi:hypothetical protein